MPSTPEPTTTAVAPRATYRSWIALGLLLMPVLLVSVGNTVLAFALPAISAALRPTGAGLLWVVDVYPLVLAGLLVPMGSLGDRIGRRKILMVGSVGFVVVSVIAAFSPTTETLIATRAVLGFFGAMLLPATLSLIRNIFLDRTQRRLAIAIWAAGFSSGAALGSILGGALLEQFWWGSVFLLAIPFLLPMLAMARRFIPESRDPAPGRLDLLSAVLALTTMVPLVYGIKVLSIDGPMALGVASIVIALVFGVVFVRRQLSRPDPMMDVSLFRRPAFGGAVGLNLLSVMAYVGFIFFVSQHLQVVLELSPIAAGLALLPGLVGMIISGLGVVPIVERIRPGPVIVVSLGIAAAGCLLVTVSGDNLSVMMLVLAFGLLSVGIGAAHTVSNDLIVSTAPPEKSGAAAAISETAYEVGAVFGTAALATVVTVIYRNQVVVPAGVPAADAATAGETIGGAAAVAASLPTALAADLLESARMAFSEGVAITSGVGCALIVASMVVAGVVLRRIPAGTKADD